MIKQALRRIWPQSPERMCFVLPPKDRRFCTGDWKDNGFYLSSAIQEVFRLIDLCGLSHESRFLDIGCGQGRLAIGLQATFPKLKSYLGVDVHRPSVDWCQRYLARSNFAFVHVNTPNERYNPTGKTAPKLPADSGSIDVAFLYSVFTHMRLDDIKAHLAEIKRCLKPGGKVLLTVYVEDWPKPEEENPNGYLRELGENIGALHRVVIDKATFETACREAGLSIDAFLYRSETVTLQSAYVLAA